MPEIVNEFPPTAKGSRSKWERYCNGQIWKFTAEDCKTLGMKDLKNIRSILYGQARTKTHRHARIHEVDGALYV